ncbi:hypothetical protein [Streptomyces gibsoniae]|uniref:Proteins of 100 residues with WXG n=1 Tax=Streptomyces gibsoniae TaxID=3075529 RepID=A0ABU2TPT8_9ACTN|nr:hypothetical protein [Streptomyces sp. DSM 41699]MDT0462966.1 hypothetical protein [Streptomyces sp. DSM 41699]
MSYGGINLDYDKIDGVVGQLNTAHDQVVPLLTNLRTQVNNLVDDGMVFQQSSETIRNTYNQFDTSLASAVKGITEFSDMFNNIKTNAQAFDKSISDGLTKSDGKGGS